jgi:hypothetical protein
MDRHQTRKGTDPMADIRINPEVAAPKFDRAAHCRNIGMKGGLATKAKYAPNGETGYYSSIGAIGFQAYADNHHEGNRKAALEGLKAMHNPDRNVRQPGSHRQLKG